MRKAALAILSAWLLVFASCAVDLETLDAQDLGSVGLRTVAAQLANGTTCTGNAQTFTTGVTPNFNNLGQTQHQVSASSGAASFTLEIDGVDAVGTVIRISSPTISFQNGTPVGYVAQGTGWYPQVQVSVTCTAGATFSMSYSGSSGGATPIIAAPGTTPTVVPSFVGDVQGVQSTGVNGVNTNPIINGGVQVAINAGFNNLGVDNFSGATFAQASGVSGTLTQGTPPAPTISGELGFAWLAWPGAPGGTGVLSPWSCTDNGSGGTGGGSCGNSSFTSAGIALLQVTGVSTAKPLQYNVGNTNAGTTDVIFVDVAKTPTVRQHNGSLSANPGLGATASGSTVFAAFGCSGGAPCSVASVTDTQGNTWRKVQDNGVGLNSTGRLSVWITGPVSAAAITITPTAAAGSNTVNISSGLELSSVTAASPNQPTTPQIFSRNTALPGENDPGGAFIERAGFSFSETRVVTVNPTTVPLWSNTNHGAFLSCQLELRVTATSGTTPTLNTFLQDSADNVGFNDRLSLTQAGSGSTSLIGSIPLFTAGALTPTTNGAVVSTDGVLAAGSAIAGTLGPFGRIKFVTGGTTPSFTVTYNVTCQ